MTSARRVWTDEQVDDVSSGRHFDDLYLSQFEEPLHLRSPLLCTASLLDQHVHVGVKEPMYVHLSRL
jgi:hypothetical protein